MSTTRWNRVDAIFAGALTLPVAARSEYVANACGADAELRSEVEALLEAADAGDALLDDRFPNLVRTAFPPPPSFPSGHQIGPYRVLELLGEGGMGAVYLAERADGQFDQRVAIKLVHPAYVRGGDVIERFLRERQILARLEHPNIARLLDGGVTTEGWPYLVMEHVEGRPIAAFCDAHRLTIAERIRLLQDVGRAVQHAHRNLVIHRDLKPSNILVTADGVPKLLDFGIAKLLEEDADITVTRTGMGMMTPGYAAPEQLRGGAVTTATDVYALGVLLYELLTGRRPFGDSDSSPLEIAEAVEREAPTAPSATLPPSLAQAAAEARSTDPRRLRRQIAGDLDRICLMALRKEPDRRYDSAQALVDDLQRHLDARPVVARPDTVGYRTRKFVARNRTGVAAAVLVAVALVAGLAAALWQADIARTEAAKAGEVRDFVLGLFEAGDPALATGDTITVQSLLDRGAQRIENELAGQPALQADMYSLLGPIYARLGLFDDGRTMLTRALDLHAAVSGRASEPHAMATFELARLEHRAGQTDLAARLYRDAGSWLSNVAGPRSATVGRAEQALGDIARIAGRYEEADSLYIAAREKLVAADIPPAELLVLDLEHLQVVHTRSDDARADSVYARIVANRSYMDDERSITLARSMMLLGLESFYRGETDRAESLFRGALDLRREVYGERHTDVALAMTELADIHWRRGQFDLAVDTRRRAVDMLRETLGPDHPEYAMRLGSLGVMLAHKGNLEEGAAALAEAQRIQVPALGESHIYVAVTRRNLGRTLMALGRFADALPLLEKGLASWLAAMGDSGFYPPETRMDIAITLAETGRPAAADSVAQSVMAAFRANPPAARAMGQALVALAHIRAANGRTDEAAALVRDALARYDADGIPERDLVRARAQSALGGYLLDSGDTAAAEPLLLSAHQTFEALRGPSSDDTVTARDRLARLYRDTHRPDEAARFAVDRR